MAEMYSIARINSIAVALIIPKPQSEHCLLVLKKPYATSLLSLRVLGSFDAAEGSIPALILGKGMQEVDIQYLMIVMHFALS